jgi:uncharacterized membrane protein YoaK (UPF0700 family)
MTIGAGLAAIAGYVDAIGFTKLFGVFPANQSGNAVLLGIAIGDTKSIEAWRPALAIAAFAVGVVAGGVLGKRIPRARRTTVLLAVETVLLALLALFGGDLSGVSAPYGGGKEGALLAIAAIAMGLQTDIVRRAGGVAVITTYETGTITRVADTLTAPPPDTADDAPAPAARRLRAVLLVILVSYIAGAAVGEALADGWGAVLWGACAASVMLTVGALATESFDDDAGAG